MVGTIKKKYIIQTIGHIAFSFSHENLTNFKIYFVLSLWKVVTYLTLSLPRPFSQLSKEKWRYSENWQNNYLSSE